MSESESYYITSSESSISSDIEYCRRGHVNFYNSDCSACCDNRFDSSSDSDEPKLIYIDDMNDYIKVLSGFFTTIQQYVKLEHIETTNTIIKNCDVFYENFKNKLIEFTAYINNNKENIMNAVDYAVEHKHDESLKILTKIISLNNIYGQESTESEPMYYIDAKSCGNVMFINDRFERFNKTITKKFNLEEFFKLNKELSEYFVYMEDDSFHSTIREMINMEYSDVFDYESEQFHEAAVKFSNAYEVIDIDFKYNKIVIDLEPIL